MYREVIASLDKLADSLQTQGHKEEAQRIDVLSNTLEKIAAKATVVLRFPTQFADEVSAALESAAAGKVLQGQARTTLNIVLEKFLRPQLLEAATQQSDQQARYAFNLPFGKKDPALKDLEKEIGERVKSDPAFLANKAEIVDRTKEPFGSSKGRFRTKTKPTKFIERFVEGPDGIYEELLDDHSKSLLTPPIIEKFKRSARMLGYDLPSRLDKVASILEARGDLKLAEELDVISNTLSQPLRSRRDYGERTKDAGPPYEDPLGDAVDDAYKFLKSLSDAVSGVYEAASGGGAHSSPDLGEMGAAIQPLLDLCKKADREIGWLKDYASKAPAKAPAAPTPPTPPQKVEF